MCVVSPLKVIYTWASPHKTIAPCSINKSSQSHDTFMPYQEQRAAEWDTPMLLSDGIFSRIEWRQFSRSIAVLVTRSPNLGGWFQANQFSVLLRCAADTIYRLKCVDWIAFGNQQTLSTKRARARAHKPGAQQKYSTMATTSDNGWRWWWRLKKTQMQFIGFSFVVCILCYVSFATCSPRLLLTNADSEHFDFRYFG